MIKHVLLFYASHHRKSGFADQNFLLLKADESFMPEYEDITPVPSESETTPTTSFAEGTPGSKSQQFPKFPTPSPRKLEAIALVSARFNLIHPPDIRVTPATPQRDSGKDVGVCSMVETPLLPNTTKRHSENESKDIQNSIRIPEIREFENRRVDGGNAPSSSSSIETDSVFRR